MTSKYKQLEIELKKYEELKKYFKEFLELIDEVKVDILTDKYLTKEQYKYCKDDILTQKEHLISFKEEDYHIYALSIFSFICHSSMGDDMTMDIIKLDEKKFKKIIELYKEDSQFFSRLWKRPSVYIEELVRWEYVSKIKPEDILKRIMYK